jgi:spermidine synthase
MTSAASPPASQSPPAPPEPTPDREGPAAHGISPWALRLLVVTAGMTTMGTEMAAARLLQPFFGASTIVWANIIGLILIYLSIGYWYGGKVADRHPHARGLSLLTLAAAVTIAIVPFIAGPVLRMSVGGIDSVEVGTVVGSFIGTLLLFIVPITLLGMVPPYAVRLALRDVGSSGEVAGGLYALSTVGSILGTFGSVLFLIPAIGTRRTMLVFALALALLSLPGLWKVTRGRMLVLAAALGIGVLLAIPVGFVKAAPGTKVLFEQESTHQFVQVLEDDEGRRLLSLNEGWAVHSVWEDDTVLTGNIWDRFLVLPALRETDGTDSQGELRMLVIGNAAGSGARMYAKYRPNVEIDGVEIDHVVSEAGYEYFDMPRDNLTVHTADGRPFIERSDERWDVILIDAYRQPYIPFYLTTKEFFEEVEEHLAPGGVLAINVGSSPDDNRIQEAVGATMRSVLPSVYRHQAVQYNELIVATKEPATQAALSERLLGSDLASNAEVGHLFRRMAADLQEVEPAPERVLTDDHAPVEWMTDRMIFQEAQRQ